MDIAVETVDLTKEFPKPKDIRSLLTGRTAQPQLAVDAVNLQIFKGELFGLLGANGAGKTTLIKMLSTLVIPTAGHAKIQGFDVVKEANAVKRLIGLVDCQDRSFFWRLTGRQNLEFFAAIYGLKGKEASRRIEELLKLTKLHDHADRRFSDYSSGMRQMLAIARGLLTMPPILFMDEPTRSLDPISASMLRTFIRDVLVDQLQCTVLLVTHRLDEADELCDRIAIMHQGQLIACGPTADVKRSLDITLEYELQVRRLLPLDHQQIQALPGVVSTQCVPNNSDVSELQVRMLNPADTLPQILRIIMLGGGEIQRCQLREPSLEDAFVTIVGSGNATRNENSGFSKRASQMRSEAWAQPNVVGGR